MPNTAQGFCEEFCLSIDPSRYITGNWFGRLLAYKYKIYNFFENEYSEEEFREKIDDGSIKILAVSVPSNVAVSFGNDVTTTGTITGEFEVTVQIDNAPSETKTYAFEHQVRWSIHATQTTLTEI